MAEKIPPLLCFNTLKIDSSALPLILKGVMKYLPFGDTVVKNHSQNDRNSFTTTRSRSQV